jgi:hypothetical protein
MTECELPTQQKIDDDRQDYRKQYTRRNREHGDEVIFPYDEITGQFEKWGSRKEQEYYTENDKHCTKDDQKSRDSIHEGVEPCQSFASPETFFAGSLGFSSGFLSWVPVVPFSCGKLDLL